MDSTFISYSWDNELHCNWVVNFASRLRQEGGVDIRLDCWHAEIGCDLAQFMEYAIENNKYILVICTPTYKYKSDTRIGGVGYEGSIITSKMIYEKDKRKVIPILREGDWIDSAPTWLAPKKYLDFRGTTYSEVNYQELLRFLHGSPTLPPKIGPIPKEIINNNKKPQNGSNILSQSSEQVNLRFQTTKEKQKNPHRYKDIELKKQSDDLIRNNARTADNTSVDILMRQLIDANIGKCKLLDFELSKHSTPYDQNRMEYYLFNGIQRQANYAALYFARLGNGEIIKEACKKGKIDRTQYKAAVHLNCSLSL